MEYTTDQAVKVTGVTPNQLSQWIKRGSFALAIPQPSGHGIPRRFTLADLRHLAFLQMVVGLGLDVSAANGLWARVDQNDPGTLFLGMVPGAARPSVDDAPIISTVAASVDVAGIFQALDASLAELAA